MGEVGEASRGIGMIRPKARLVDCERAPVHWLGLNEAARGLEQLGEVVSSPRDRAASRHCRGRLWPAAP
jgi:hypothetical protein